MMAKRLESRWSERWLISSAAHGTCCKAKRLTFHTDLKMNHHVNKSRQLICATARARPTQPQPSGADPGDPMAAAGARSLKAAGLS